MSFAPLPAPYSTAPDDNRTGGRGGCKLVTLLFPSWLSNFWSESSFWGGGRRRIGCCKAQMEELCKSGRPSGDRTGVTAGDDSAKKGPLGVVGGILVGVQEILTRNILKRRVKKRGDLKKRPQKNGENEKGGAGGRSLLQLKLFFARELFFSSLLL